MPIPLLRLRRSNRVDERLTVKAESKLLCVAVTVKDRVWLIKGKISVIFLAGYSPLFLMSLIAK